MVGMVMKIPFNPLHVPAQQGPVCPQKGWEGTNWEHWAGGEERGCPHPGLDTRCHPDVLLGDIAVPTGCGSGLGSGLASSPASPSSCRVSCPGGISMGRASIPGKRYLIPVGAPGTQTRAEPPPLSLSPPSRTFPSSGAAVPGRAGGGWDTRTPKIPVQAVQLQCDPKCCSNIPLPVPFGVPELLSPPQCPPLVSPPGRSCSGPPQPGVPDLDPNDPRGLIPMIRTIPVIPTN